MSNHSIQKIGVLTGGGDCPGLNAVIRAVVKTAIDRYGIQVIGYLDGFSGLVKNQWVELNQNIVSGILPRGGTILGTTNRDNPFHFPIEENGKIQYIDMSGQAIENLQNNGVGALIVIGGDGSLKIANELGEKGLSVVGVPKTIDNDLSATDVTFGFDTALVTATEALDKLHTTAESHHRVMVLEVMGRYAGWIALHAGIAGGADVILIPEIPYQMESICQKIRQRRANGKKFSIVVVAEGAKPVGGQMVVNRYMQERTDPVKLGGIGQVVAEQLENLLNMETRVTVLGHLQRGGTPTPFDRLLATRYGAYAVQLVMKKQFGQMVSLRGNLLSSVSIQEAVGELKFVEPDSDTVTAAKSIGISFGDEIVS